MKTSYVCATTAAIGIMASPGLAQRSCSQYGSTVYCSDGYSATRYGNTT